MQIARMSEGFVDFSDILKRLIRDNDIWINANETLPDKWTWVVARVEYGKYHKDVITCYLGDFHWHYEYSTTSFINGNITHWYYY